MKLSPRNPAVLFFGLTLLAVAVQTGAYASSRRRGAGKRQGG